MADLRLWGKLLALGPALLSLPWLFRSDSRGAGAAWREFGRRALGGLALGLAWLALLFGVAWLLRRTAGITPMFTTLIGAGLTYLLLTTLRPRWFWEHPAALQARSTIGDAGTLVFYSAVSLVLLGLGVFGAVADLTGR